VNRILAEEQARSLLLVTPTLKAECQTLLLRGSVCPDNPWLHFCAELRALDRCSSLDLVNDIYRVPFHPYPRAAVSCLAHHRCRGWRRAIVMLDVIHVLFICNPFGRIFTVAAAESALAAVYFERKALARTSVVALVRACLSIGYTGGTFKQRTCWDGEAVY